MRVEMVPCSLPSCESQFESEYPLQIWQVEPVKEAVDVGIANPESYCIAAHSPLTARVEVQLGSVQPFEEPSITPD